MYLIEQCTKIFAIQVKYSPKLNFQTTWVTVCDFYHSTTGSPSTSCLLLLPDAYFPCLWGVLWCN